MADTSLPTLSQPDDDELVRDAMRRMEHAIEVRNSMHLRIANRVTSLIRVGMISLGMIALAFLSLMLILSLKLETMITAMETMNKHFRAMSDEMATMKQKIIVMDTSVQSMPLIVAKVQEMDRSVNSMTQDMAILAERMNAMNGKISTVSANVARMTDTFVSMDQAVYGIGRDVNTMSAPMKDFNGFRSFMPW